MKVVNIRDYNGSITKAVKAGVIYCGRPNPLGNPCSVPNIPCPICFQIHFGKGMVQLTDDRSLKCYAKWLYKEITNGNKKVLTLLKELQDDDTLGCWCAPKPCHCDIIILAHFWCRQNGYLI